MITPIVLTRHGDLLELRQVDKRTEDSRLIVRYQDIGRHKKCWGEFYSFPISDSHDAIICQRCYLRVTLKRIRGQGMTYRELRKVFSTRPGPVYFRLKCWIQNLLSAE